jgi:putative ABC transport system substrate-binding protein
LARWPYGPSRRAQEPGRTYRLGLLNPTGPGTPQIGALLDELRLHGYIEGQNLTVLPGGINVPLDQLADVVAALIRAAPDAIVCGPEHYIRAVQRATGTIPLVAMSEDLVAEGLVTSLARPGGNTTGINMLSPELDSKRQGVLIEAVPTARKMAAMADAATSQQHLNALHDAARVHGVEISVFNIAKREEIVPAIAAAQAAGVGALNFLATPLFSINRQLVFVGVAASRLPAIYQWPEMAEEGGLMAYGTRNAEIYRQRARILVKVLRGTKPADIPVEQPTRFELVINLQTAKAIGYEIPAGLVLRADKIIE